MTLKGDAEHISLLSIFQTLSLSRQRGILAIHSGSRKRKILFTNQGLRLIANYRGDTEPLKGILQKLKILTESQFQNTISTKNDDTLPIGEFLIQRRIVDSGMVEGPIAQHVLELVFETFSWKDAKYEFHPAEDAEGLELFSPSGLGVSLTFQVEAIMMEVSYREDEWLRIRERFPSGREILAPVDPSSFFEEREYDCDLSTSVIRDVKRLVNGELSVNAIAEATVLSSFEASQALMSMSIAGEIRPLDVDELKELAESFRRQFRIPELIDTLDYILTLAPEDVSTRLQLVSVLEKRGQAGKGLEAHYRILANYYSERGETNEAETYFCKTLEQNPYCLDSLVRLFEIHVTRAEDRIALTVAKRIIDSVKLNKRYDDGCEALTRILEVYPDEFPFYHVLAEFYLLAGLRAEAAATLKKVAAFYEGRGDLTRLRKTYERIAAMDPSEAAVLKRIQEVERRRNRSFAQSLAPTVITAAVTAISFSAMYWVLLTFFCHRAYASVEANVEALLKAEDYRGARESLVAVRDAFPFTLVEWSISRRVEKIASKERSLTMRIERAQEEGDTRFTTFLVQIQRQLSEKKFDEALGKLRKFKGENPHLSEENQATLKAMEAEILGSFQRARALLDKAESLTAAGKYEEAHPLFVKILMEYPRSPAAKGLLLPLFVQSSPTGADVNFNGATLGRTPLLLRYRPFAPFSLRIQKFGFGEFSCESVNGVPTCLDFSKDWILLAKLELVPLREQKLPGGIENPLTLDEDRLFAVVKPGTVICLDPERGDTRWTYSTHGNSAISSGVRTWRKYAFFGSYDGRFTVLESASGQLVFDLEGSAPGGESRVVASRATPRGAVAIQGFSKLAGIDLKKRRRLWELRFKGLGDSPPLPYGEFFVAVSMPGEILVISAADGSVQRRIRLECEFENPGAVFGDSLFIADRSGTARRVALDSGKTIWSSALKSSQMLVPNMSDELAVFGSRTGSLFALDVNTGEMRWNLAVPGGLWAPGVLLRNQLIIGSSEGLLLCLDVFSGKLYWNFESRGAFRAPPCLGRTSIFAGTAEGTLYRFSVQ